MGKYLHKYDNFADFEKSYNAKHNVSQIVCNNGEVFEYDSAEDEPCIAYFESENDDDDRYIEINDSDLSNLAVGDSITVLQYNGTSGVYDPYTYTIEDIVRTGDIYNKPGVSYTKYEVPTKISMTIDGRTCTFNYVGVINAEEEGL